VGNQVYLLPKELITVVIVVLLLLVYWLAFLPRPQWRRYFLLVVCMVTIPFAEYILRSRLGRFNISIFPYYTLLCYVLTLIVWAVGRFLASGKSLRGLVFFLGIAFVVLYLSYFKYRHLLHAPGWRAILFPVRLVVKEAGESFVIRWGIPLGISFYSFRLISYLIDSYRGLLKRAPLHEFLMYIIFFPTYPVGPIERFGRFQKQFDNTLQCKPEYIAVGWWRILLGVFKWTVVANWLLKRHAEDIVHGNWAGLSTDKLWVKAYAYSLYIYTEFSAVSDIAIGCSLLFGFKIMENFNWPYLRTNISQFWRNWHISLTTWLTDYVFTPISRRLMKTPLKKTMILVAITGYIITMFLCGIWHGDDLTFAIWGLYHGVGLAIWKIWSELKLRYFRRKILPKGVGAVLGCLLTFHFLALGWPMFARVKQIPNRQERVPDLKGAWEMTKRMLFITKPAKKQKPVIKEKPKKAALGGRDAGKTHSAGGGRGYRVSHFRDADARHFLHQEPGIGIHLRSLLAARKEYRYEGKGQGVDYGQVQTGPRTWRRRATVGIEHNRFVRYARTR